MSKQDTIAGLMTSAVHAGEIARSDGTPFLALFIGGPKHLTLAMLPEITRVVEVPLNTGFVDGQPRIKQCRYARQIYASGNHVQVFSEGGMTPGVVVQAMAAALTDLGLPIADVLAARLNEPTPKG